MSEDRPFTDIAITKVDVEFLEAMIEASRDREREREDPIQYLKLKYEAAHEQEPDTIVVEESGEVNVGPERARARWRSAPHRRARLARIRGPPAGQEQYLTQSFPARGPTAAGGIKEPAP